VTELSEKEIEFLQHNRTAAMITVDLSGVAKTARVGVGLVDGQLWSSGTQDRMRTRRLRRDPRCTLFVFSDSVHWLTVEATVSILDGPEAPELNVRFFRQIQDRPTGPLSWFGGDLDEDAFRARMVEEGRLIYQFGVERTYGMP
jgi:hypothetical protein